MDQRMLALFTKKMEDERGVIYVVICVKFATQKTDLFQSLPTFNRLSFLCNSYSEKQQKATVSSVFLERFSGDDRGFLCVCFPNENNIMAVRKRRQGKDKSHLCMLTFSINDQVGS